MRRIRVLQVVSGIAIGDQSGGAEQFAVQLARHLPQDSFESAVFAMWRFGSSAEREWLSRLERERIPVYGLVSPSGALGRDLAGILGRLWRTVSDFRPDVVGTHSERGDVFNAILRVTHPQHPVAIRTMHTDQQWQNRPRLGLLLSQSLFPVVFHAEVAVSEAVRAVLDRRPLARLLRKRAVLCYNGVDASLFAGTPASGRPSAVPSGVPESRPLLGAIGRLTEQKGLVDLLRAMRLVVDRQPAHLLVIGSGPLEQDLRATARGLGLAEHVHFLGSREDVLAILPCLDMVVSSSLWEGFPTVLLEAMALGVPVVASDVSGSRELVRDGETGVLAPPRAPAKLAEAILSSLADREGARAMAARARIHASRYTIQNAALRFGEICRRNLRGPAWTGSGS